MIKAQVVRFLPPDEGDDPPKSLPKQFRNKLLSGVILSQNLRCKNADAELFGDIKVHSYGIEFRLRGIGGGFGFAAADVRFVLCDFTSTDANKFIVYYRLRAQASRYVHVDLFEIELENTMQRYTAFWQAWSVPVCDDVRRIVFGFLE